MSYAIYPRPPPSFIVDPPYEPVRHLYSKQSDFNRCLTGGELSVFFLYQETPYEEVLGLLKCGDEWNHYVS